MTEYNYLFGLLRNERILAEIPLHGTYCDLELNVGGRFDGSFNLDMSGFDNATLIEATTPGRCWVAVIRNGKCIWTGFIWSRTYQSQAKSVQMFAQSFEKYPEYQLIRSSLSLSLDDQRNIFRQLWTGMQAVTGRDINIRIPSAFDVVVPATFEVLDTDFKFYAEAMSELADTATGFDWTIVPSMDGNLIAKDLSIGYPYLGTTSTSVVFEYPGSILNYYATESMADAGTNVFTLGSGEGSSSVYAESTQDAMITYGWPRWDTIVNRKEINDQFVITGLAGTEGARRKPPMLTIKPTMKANVDPKFGFFGLGDTARVDIVDARFPAGKSFTSRVTKWTLQPQSSQNTEEYTVLFENDEE